MESVLSNFEDGKNFWKAFPSYRAPKLYKQLYDVDKSKGKSASSKLMWALHFLFDKSEYNPWARNDEDARLEVINEEIIGNVKFDWSKHEELSNEIQSNLMDEMGRQYYALVKKMDQRSKLLRDTDYSMENAAELDKLFVATDKLRIELKKMKDALADKDSGGRSKGGMQESASEKGDI